MKVVDLDSHSEPRAQDYQIPPEYSHLRPRAFMDARGNRRLTFDNELLLLVHADDTGVADKAGKQRWNAARYDADVRYELVKEMGVDIQYISAGTVGDFNYADPGVGSAFWRSYNDFLHDRFVKAYPDTFIGVPQLPMQDIPLAIQELERCVKDLGMHTVVLPTNWNGIDLADPYWWNFYDKVQELGITGILIHVKSTSAHSHWVGKERLAALGGDGTTGRRILSHPFEYSTNIANMIFGGMMDSFPDFRFAFLEGGAEFAIVLKHRIEENVGQLGYLREKLAHPLEWYFDRLYFLVDDHLMAKNGRMLEYAIEELGADHLYIGSDLTHGDPQMETFNEVRELGNISDEVKEKILGGNANTLMSGKLF